MMEIIEKVKQVQPIADELHSEGLISDDEHSKICAPGTSELKMRKLYRSLERGGTSVKTAFYRLLIKHEADLFTDL
ncbi:hypothetical protein Z043_125787, partial [Scleropages formosus]